MEKDRGLWITWYDLPDAGREEHVRWVHETYTHSVAGLATSSV